MRKRDVVIITRSCGTQVRILRSELDTSRFQLNHVKNGLEVYSLRARLRLLKGGK